ncbi:MAG: sugar ABC transporter permease [Propionivibrio sp.]
MLAKKPGWCRNAGTYLALVPMFITVVFVYVGSTLWSFRVSLSSARTFPAGDFVGLTQYVKLFGNDRWLMSLKNAAIFGVLFISLCLVLGFLLAVFLDQRIRGESIFRTIFLYPYAMSFVATGLVWQWILNPTLGIQEAVRQLGAAGFTFNWIVSQDLAIYTIVLASVWQASGLAMALILAGLRGVDEEIWKATRIDGIPPWRVYLSIVLPMIGPSIATVCVLLSVSVVKLFDAVVSMTQGGPGTATEVPAKFIMDYLFGRANIGLASAASTVMLLLVLSFLLPWVYLRQQAARKENKR